MYNLIRDLKELTSQSVSSTCFIPKAFRSKIDFFRYNQLPPIKEEEGNITDSEIELRNIVSNSRFSNYGSYETGFEINKKNTNEENRRKKSMGEEWTKSEDPPWKVPPLVNVNCLMNVDMKQRKFLWKTSFGKRLMNGKTAISETLTSSTVKKAKKDNEKSMENKSIDEKWKSVNSSQSFFSERIPQLGSGDKMAQVKKKKTKPPQVKKKSRKLENKREYNDQAPSETNTENNTSKSNTDCTKSDLPSSESLHLTTSRKSRKQNLVSRYVKIILGGDTPQYDCKHCDQIFSNAEEFNSHKKKHESEKQTCILCCKVFYEPREFTRHLLTHESVDKFSCKKCKKYFPTRKKYKAHSKDAHPKNSKSVEAKNDSSLECKKNWAPKYECKRCQLEFDSDENFRAHKGSHIKLDLMGAYLLSNKRF